MAYYFIEFILFCKTAFGAPFCNTSLENLNETGLTDPYKSSILILSCTIPHRASWIPTENIVSHTVIIQYIHRSNLEDYSVISSNSTDRLRLNCSVNRTDIVSTSSKELYKFQCRVTYEEFLKRTPNKTFATNIPDHYFYFEANCSTIWRKDHGECWVLFFENLKWLKIFSI